MGLLVGELQALVGRYILMIARSNRTAVTVWDSDQLKGRSSDGSRRTRRTETRPQNFWPSPIVIWERRRPPGLHNDWASTLPTTQRCRLRQPRLRPAASVAVRARKPPLPCDRLIESLTLVTDAGSIKKFDIFRKKRYISDYERANTISASDVEEMRSLAEKLRVDFEAWIQKNHPQLKP